MDLGDLLTLQGTLFLLMLLGAYLTKKGVITKEGKRCLTDLVVYVILPVQSLSPVLSIRGPILQLLVPFCFCFPLSLKWGPYSLTKCFIGVTAGRNARFFNMGRSFPTAVFWVRQLQRESIMI